MSERTQDEIERNVDDLLGAFQRACENVVVPEDCTLIDARKERAILRNEIRARLLRAAE